MWNAGLDEAQAGIKIAGRNININNLRYANDTTVMAESEEELRNILMKLKEENEKAVLKLSFLGPVCAVLLCIVIQSRLTLCDPMDCSPLEYPVVFFSS